MSNLFGMARIIGTSFLMTILLTSSSFAQSNWDDEEAPFQKAYAEGYEQGMIDGQEKMQVEAKKEYERLKEEYERVFATEIKKVEEAYQEELKARTEGRKKAVKVVDGKQLTPYQNKKFDEILAKSPSEVFEEARKKIRHLPDEEIEKNIIEQFADGPVGTLVSKSGFVRRFIVAMIKDDKAAPRLLRIADEIERIWIFVFASMFITTVSFFINRKLKKATLEAYGDTNLEKEVKKKKLLFLLAKIVVWVVLFVAVFGTFIVPTIAVLFRSF